MNLYEHTIIAKQNFTKSQLDTIKNKYTNLIKKNNGELIKIEDWGLLNLSYKIAKNRKGNYLHFKLKGDGITISQLEKNERIDNNLLRAILSICVLSTATTDIRNILPANFQIFENSKNRLIFVFYEILNKKC